MRRRTSCRALVLLVALVAGAVTPLTPAVARNECPAVCEGTGGRWDGEWRTTVQGRMSVCKCYR